MDKIGEQHYMFILIEKITADNQAEHSQLILIVSQSVHSKKNK